MQRPAVHIESCHDNIPVSPRETESMALTTVTTATSASGHRSVSTASSKGRGSTAAAHEAPTFTSSIGAPSLRPMATAKSPPFVSAATSATGARKRPRRWTEHRSSSYSRDGGSPSSPTKPEDLGRCTNTHAESSGEVLFEEIAERDSPAHLQHTPTSQLLSQRQAPPYSALSEDQNAAPQEPAVEQALFTPATVARRPQPQSLLGKALRSSALSASSAPSAASSASRPSSHDEAVQAILRANPPTTTRPVQLKPGYKVPSPQTPLWVALEDDGDDEDDAARSSGQGLEEPLLSSTQVSLFQLGDEEETSSTGAVRMTARAGVLPCSRQTSATTAATVSTVGVHVPTTTHECRRLGKIAASNASISLPAPGRSLNLLDEDGLHDDERLPLFVGMEGDSQGDDTDDRAFSLTQEARRQDRAQDVQAVLPRSRAHRGAAGAAATRASAAAELHAGKLGSADMSTPSPARQRAVRISLSAPQQQVSPFSQLQRDVESTMAAAAAAESERHTTAPAASAKPLGALSQKKLRRTADMLKWAERTRAFFHFIDTRPLQVTLSPLKPPASTPSQLHRRSSSSRSAVAGGHRGSIGGVQRRKSRRAEASMSLVRRSHSASTTPASPLRSAAEHSSDSAFEAVISRVRQQAAAAADTVTRRTSAK
ncbi:hypothetical protein CUR178_00865 [Leishmania enriettii]|uniref:Uncharacterized protein n=1 Tax=Leishmania enriettii TaxID=5663 RepID=A0A836K8J3_LEIEN|nr:hypothetical protein CUR178_00865 [Leishmania enriettii]